MQALVGLYNFASSMKTGLVLLVLIGVAAAIGSSMFPDTFYHTPVFKLLLVLLLFNLALCTIKRFSKTSRLLLAKPGGRLWFRHTGILLLHLGIVLVLTGGVLFSVYGQSERIHLLKGEKTDLSQVLDIKDPLTLRLDEFRIELNEDGSPSQYISEVTLLLQGQEVGGRTISVNHPLSYRGVKAYQTSYGYRVNAEYVDQDGERTSASFFEGMMIKPAHTRRTVKIYRYIPDFDPANGMGSASLRPDNPHVIFSVYEDDRFLGVGTARLQEAAQIDDEVYINFAGVEAYTVLEVKHDPGLPLVLAGGIIMMLGVSLALLTLPVRSKPE